MRGYFGIKKRGKSHNKLMPILHTKMNYIFGFFEAEKRVNLWIVIIIKLNISIMTDKIRIDNQRTLYGYKTFLWLFQGTFRLTYSPLNPPDMSSFWGHPNLHAHTVILT